MAGVVIAQVVDSFVEATFDVAFAEDEEECDEDGFALLFRFFAVFAAHSNHVSCSLQRCFGEMGQVQRHFDAEE